MRAASSAWMVGGISSSASSTAVVQRSPSRRSAPSFTSMRTSSPRKSGLPSLVASTRPATAAGSASAPITLAASRVAAPASRPPSVTTSETRPPDDASDERVSRSSGRAAASTSSGTPAPHCTRCSTRSSSSGSAHWRSSIASTSGCAVASAASRRRTTKKVSSGEAGVPASSASMPLAIRARSSPPRSTSATHSRAVRSARAAPRQRREGGAARRVARGGQHGRALAQPARELAEQPRLAEARRAEQHGEPGRGRGDGRLVHGRDPAQLGLASDERDRRRARRPLERLDPVRRHRLRAALEREASDTRQRHLPGHETLRGLADQHVAVARLLLEPRRDVERIADAGAVVVADHHLARVQRDAQAERAHALALLARELAEGALHVHGGAHRAEGVVLRHARHAEGAHHAVAEELHHAAAVRLDRRAHGAVVALHQPAHRLRVEALVERGRADQVGEEDRDDLARDAVLGGSRRRTTLRRRRRSGPRARRRRRTRDSAAQGRRRSPRRTGRSPGSFSRSSRSSHRRPQAARVTRSSTSTSRSGIEKNGEWLASSVCTVQGIFACIERWVAMSMARSWVHSM